MKDTRSRSFLIVVVLIAYGWRVTALDRQSLWRDEVDAIYFAVRDLPETLAMFIQAAQNGPLYFLVLRPWFALLGTTEFVLRYPSALTGTVTVPLLWQITRRLLPDRDNTPASIAVVGALLFAFNPYQVWYGQEGKMYATITCLAVLATWCWLNGIDRGGWLWWLSYWVVVSVAMHVHLLMVLIVPVHALWYMIAWPASRSHWRGYGLALAGLILPYLPMAWWQWEFLTSSTKVTGFRYKPFDEVLRAVYLSQGRGFALPTELIWLAPLIFLLAAGALFGGAAVASRRAESAVSLAPARRRLLVLTWAVAPVVLIFLLSLRQPVFTERYVIWIGPALLLLLALGLRVVVLYGGRLGQALGGILLAYVLIFWSYGNWQQKTITVKYDLRSAVQYVSERRDPSQLLILQIPHQEWSYRYYSSDFGADPFAQSDARLGHWIGGPYTNQVESDSEAMATVDAYLRPATAGHAVWLMLSEQEMWDQRHLTEAWLDAHGKVIDQAEFYGVSVRKYELSPADTGPNSGGSP